MSDLRSKKCTPGASVRLTGERAAALLAEIPRWKVEGEELVKEFKFKNYYESMAFVNATAWISHREDHHPDLEVGYNKVKVRYSTHSAGGLTENDFICAAKIEALFTL